MNSIIYRASVSVLMLSLVLGCQSSNSLDGDPPTAPDALPLDQQHNAPFDIGTSTTDAATPRCGNGLLEASESCDDGNLDNGDGCDANCTVTACGNGELSDGESCDDGNLDSGDGCDANCTLTACGNGIITGEEECEDSEGCRSDCRFNQAPSIQSIALQPMGSVYVGDTLECVVQTSDIHQDAIELIYQWTYQGEHVGSEPTLFVEFAPGGVIECAVSATDGVLMSAPSVVSLVIENRCGDGYPFETEQCDDGNENQFDGCLTTCTLARCGDGIVQHDVEQCDDAGQGAGCSEQCQILPRYECSGLNPSVCASRCGNGVVESDEDCEPMEGDAGACTAYCSWVNRCGDGLLDPEEACDDGNVLAGDGCTQDCQNEAGCIQIDGSNVNLTIGAVPESVIAVGAHVYWLNSHRLIERMTMDGRHHQSRMLPPPLMGRDIQQVFALEYGLLIQMAIDADGAASLWYLPTSQFLSAAPILIHRAQTVFETNGYHRVWTEAGTVFIVGRTEVGEMLVSIAPRALGQSDCTPNTGCGLVMIDVLGAHSNGPWSRSSDGALFLTQTTGGADSALPGVYRLDGVHPGYDLGSCAEPMCSSFAHELEGVTSAVWHRGSLFGASVSGGFFMRADYPDAQLQMLDLESGDTPWVYTTHGQLFLYGASVHVVNDWWSSEPQLVVDSSVSSPITPVPHGWLKPVPTSGGTHHVVLYQRGHQLCEPAPMVLSNSDGVRSVHAVAPAQSGAAMVGWFDGLDGAQSTRGRDGFTAVFNAEHQLTDEFILSSSHADAAERVIAVSHGAPESIQIAGMVCEGANAPCDAHLSRLDGAQSWQLDLGSDATKGTGFVLDVLPNGEPQRRVSARPMCLDDSCGLVIADVAYTAQGRVVLAQQKGNAQWARYGINGVHAVEQIDVGAHWRAVIVFLPAETNGFVVETLVSDDELKLYDFHVSESETQIRVVGAGYWRGRLSNRLGARSGNKPNGLVTETVFNRLVDGTWSPESKRLFSTETGNHAYTVGVDIAPDDTVWATGYRYARTELVSSDTEHVLDSRQRTDTWVATYQDGLGVSLQSHLIEDAHDITASGVIGNGDGGFFATAVSANTVLSKGYLFGRQLLGESFERVLEPDPSVVTRVTRPARLETGGYLVGVTTQSSTLTDLRTIRVGDVQDDVTQAAGGVGGVTTLMRIQITPAVRNCADGLCTSRCGDGALARDEHCDDGNLLPGDGCDAQCQVEPGFVCSVDAPCRTVCGDAFLVGAEQCDDGNVEFGDGCNDQCEVERGFVCDNDADCVALPLCADVDAGVDCYDVQLDRCVPSEVCVDQSQYSGASAQSLSVCFGPGCDSNPCIAARAGDHITCGSSTGACTVGVSTCDGARWSACSGQVSATAETCNGIDDDCDGIVDEALGMRQCGVGACALEVSACTDGVEAACPTAAPGAERCNAVDDDCDGRIDEALDAEVSCGIGACVRTLNTCEDGIARVCEPGAPSTESCNGVDDDCNGVVDDRPLVVCGQGVCAQTVPGCTNGIASTCRPDLAAASEETCNWIDDDCDGAVDESVQPVTCGVGACVRELDGCVNGQAPQCTPGAPTVEICNGVDDDCDGVVDNGVRCYDHECYANDDSQCNQLAATGANMAPYIHPSSTIIAPEANVVCLNPWGGGGPLGSNPVTPPPGNGNDSGGNDTQPMIFQTCAVDLQYGDVDGVQPLVSVNWGDDTFDDPAFYACETQSDPARYSFTHNYISAGSYAVTVRVEDADGLSAQVAYNLDVTLPRTEPVNPCFGFNCTVRVPGTCVVSTPIFFADALDRCQPLDGTTLCDPNNDESPCPNQGCDVNSNSVEIDVFTSPGTADDVQWHWVGLGISSTVGDLPMRTCDTGQNLVGQRLRLPCGQSGAVRALGGGTARHAGVKIGNARPTITMRAQPERVVAGESFTMSALAQDSDGEIIRYRWEIGDRLVSGDTDEVTTFIATPGRHLVKVSATDNSGARAVTGFYVEVDAQYEDFYVETSPSGDTWVADEDLMYQVHVHVPNDVNISTIETWIGLLDHSDSDASKRFGYVVYDTNTDSLALGQAEAGQTTGNGRIQLVEGAVLEPFDAFTDVLTFDLRLLSGTLSDVRRVGPIDIAYRAHLDTGEMLHVSTPGSDGWFNHAAGLYIGDIKPVIGAYGSEHTTDSPVIFAAIDGGSLVYRHARTNALVTHFVQSRSWSYGDGHSDASGIHRYQRPGAYSVQLTRTYDDGMELTSIPFEVIVLGDSDGDGTPDHLDADNDNDGVCDEGQSTAGVCAAGPDALPYNPWQSQDSDGDGVGDEAGRCFDAVPSGLSDADCARDVFPNDPGESRDSDGDGVGDNADDDDDGDGVSDAEESRLGLLPLLSDSDGDGLQDGEEIALFDGTWAIRDDDEDGVFNHLDIDSDDDGLPDGLEPFPLDDPDGDGLASIIDPDADNDGLLDGVDRTPWQFYEVAAQPGFWKNLFPAGYLSFERRHAVAGWDGRMTKQIVYPNLFGQVADYDPDDDVVLRSLPSAELGSLAQNVLPVINEQVQSSGFHCSTPVLHGTLTSGWAEHYYGPHYPFHPYHEFLRYDARIYDVRAQCTSVEPQPAQDENGLQFWHSTRQIRLRSGVDNDFTIQFTLRDRLRDILPYGHGQEIESDSETDYVLPGFDFRLYGDDGDPNTGWAWVADATRLQRRGFALATKQVGQSTQGHSIFEVKIRIPREDVLEGTSWLMLSPRVELRSTSQDMRHIAFDPSAESLRITSLVHEIAGPTAHLVTRMSESVRWDQVKDAVIDGFFQDGSLSVDSLMSQASGLYDFEGDASTHRVAVINMGTTSAGNVVDNLGTDATIDGVLVLSYRSEEIASIIDSEIECDPNLPCDWYVASASREGTAKYFQGGDILSGGFVFDLSDTQTSDGDQWAADLPEEEGLLRAVFDTSRSTQRTLNTAFDGLAGVQSELSAMKLADLDFNPFGTVGGVFQKYEIAYTYRGTPNGVPLYEIRLGESHQALADGLDPSVKWDGRKTGVRFKNDTLVEFISTELDDAGKPIPPKQFLAHGDQRLTGSTKGSTAIEQLVSVNREFDKTRFQRLMRPSAWGAALERLTGVAGVALAGAGLVIGGGMMFEYSYDEDGFWMGAVLTGQSLAELYSEYRSVRAGQALARATTQAQYATRMAQVGKWAKVTVWVGVGAEAALAGYYLYKAKQADNTLDRRMYAQQFVSSTVNAGVLAIYPVGTFSSAIYSVAMFLLSLPGEDVTGLDQDLMAEVADLGSLVVNIGLSIRPDTTETWKVRDILQDEVFPWVNFHLDRLQDDGYSPITLELDD